MPRTYPLDGAEDGNVLDGGYDWLDWSPEGGAYHPGLDLNAGAGGDADLGRLIVASAPGVVRFAERWDGRAAGYGTHLWIEHDGYAGGDWTHHAHLDALLVSAGQRVQRDQPIARCGKTGWQAWAHDHVEVLRARPDSWWQWPRGWSAEHVAAAYRNPHDWFAAMADHAQRAQRAQQEVDEMARAAELEQQLAAVAAERDALAGINAELGRQVESLAWLLGVAQGERDAWIAESERLRALAETGDELTPEQAENLARYEAVREIVARGAQTAPEPPTD